MSQKQHGRRHDPHCPRSWIKERQCNY